MTIEHYELSYDGMTTLCTRCHKNSVSEELEGYIVGYLHNIHETIEDGIPVYGREIYGLCDSCRIKLEAFMKNANKNEKEKCPYLKPDPDDPDCYICGKTIGACYCGKPKECPAFQRLLAQIFGDEKENNQ